MVSRLVAFCSTVSGLLASLSQYTSIAVHMHVLVAAVTNFRGT